MTQGQNSTHVKIVCDASYDQDLWFSGYAGIINIRYLSKPAAVRNEDCVTLTYHGVAAEQSKSQEGETLAVLAGLRQLAQRQLSRNDQRLIGCTIDIYTDCQGTRDRFYNFDPFELPSRNDMEFGYIKEIYELIDRYDWCIKINHVKAHIPDIKASPIQKLNNKVDERANDARTRAIDMMLNPQVKRGVSNQVAVLLPKDPIDVNEQNAWSHLAYHLAKKGKKIHLYIAGNPNNHPFLKALADFAMTQRVNLSSIVKPYTYKPDFLQNPLNKLELTMLRHHMKKREQYTGVKFTISDVHLHAATASRLIFGEPTASVLTSNFSGRKHPPVDVVYDLMNVLNRDEQISPYSVQDWLHTFLDYIKLPLEHGLKSVFKREGLNTQIIPETTYLARTKIEKPDVSRGSTDDIPFADDDLLHAFLTIYEVNRPSLRKRDLTYKQLTKMFIYEYREHGYDFPTTSEASIERFLYAASKNDPKKFVNRVLKQIRKLSPAYTK